MIGPARNRPADLGVDDFTQDIDAPLDELTSRQNDATLTTIDFDELEVALDL